MRNSHAIYSIKTGSKGDDMAITQKIFLLTIIITLFVVCFTFAARGETTRTEIMPGFPIKKDMEIQPTIPKQNFSCDDYLQQRCGK